MELFIQIKKKKLLESLLKEDANWEKEWSDKFEKHFSQLKNKDDVMDSYSHYASQLSPSEKALSKILIAAKNKALNRVKIDPKESKKLIDLYKSSEVILKNFKNKILEIKKASNNKNIDDLTDELIKKLEKKEDNSFKEYYDIIKERIEKL